MSERDERIAELMKRLDKGYTAIGEATAKGIEVPTWETVWVNVLREYEGLEDEKVAYRLEQAGLPAMPRSEVLV